MCEEYGWDVETLKRKRHIFSVNLTPKIISAISTVYMNEPERQFVGADERELEQLDMVYDRSMLDVSLKKANRLYNLLGQAALQIYPKNGELKTRVLAPHQYDVVCSEEDQETPIAFVRMFKKSKSGSGVFDGTIKLETAISNKGDYEYHFWTEDQIFVTNENGAVIGDTVENPIRRLPFVEISQEKDLEYWVDCPSVVAEFSKEFLLCLCDVADISKNQGYAQAVLASEEKPSDLVIGPTSYIHLPLDPNSTVQPSFSFANANPDLGSSISLLEKMLSMFLSSLNISPETISTNGAASRFTSGLDRLLAGVERFEASRDSIATFRAVEREAFSLLRDWSNDLQNRIGTDPDINGGSISEDVMFSIQFSKPEMIQTEAEKIALISQKLGLGLISRLEAIMLDRGVSEEQAAEILGNLGDMDADSSGSNPEDL